MIDDLDVVLVIDAGLVLQAIHRKLRVLAQILANFDQRGRVNHDERVGLLVHRLQNPLAEAPFARLYIWSGSIDQGRKVGVGLVPLRRRLARANARS